MFGLAIMMLLAAGPADSFAWAFPHGVRVTGSNGHLTHASNFSWSAAPSDKRSLNTPEQNARAFVNEHGLAFGVTSNLGLRVIEKPAPRQLGPVRFALELNGLPVFEADVVVGINENNEVFLVNSADLPDVTTPPAFILDERTALVKALKFVPRTQDVVGSPVASPGYYIAVSQLRPVYQIDFVAINPSGSWRVYIDAQSAKILFVFNRRLSARGNVFEVSPCQTMTQKCPLNGNMYSRCQQPAMKDLGNLSGSTLNGSQTTVYNCKGGDIDLASSGTCQQTATATGGDFNYPPDATNNDKTDNFAEVNAYYHIDTFITHLGTIDPEVPSHVAPLPAYVNNYQKNPNIPGQLAPMDNAFFDIGKKAIFMGQGRNADYSYEGEVLYHEISHCMVHGLAQWTPAWDNYGYGIEPISLHEGMADSFSQSYDNDSVLGEYVAGSDITKEPYLRDINNRKTCQGDGTLINLGSRQSINGLFGEEHFDGEIWSNFFWKSSLGMAHISTAGKCNGCTAAELIFMKGLRLSNSKPVYSSLAQTVVSAARQLYPDRAEIGDYLSCMAERHELAGCDGRIVPVYNNETKLVIMTQAIAGMQARFTSTGTGANINACGLGGSTGSLLLRKGQEVTFDGTSQFTYDQEVAVDTDCSSGNNNASLASSGEYFALMVVSSPDANIRIFSLKAGTGTTSRPAATLPKECCLRNCENRQCGTDGCTSTCGTCSASQNCSAAGQCVEKPEGGPENGSVTPDGGDTQLPDNADAINPGSEDDPGFVGSCGCALGDRPSLAWLLWLPLLALLRKRGPFDGDS